MDNFEFFSKLLELWKDTTGAEDRFWMPEEHFDKSGRFNVYAVGEDESRKLVASGLSEVDADWMTAMHGCVSDLIRCLQEAIAEADTADFNRDSRECRIFELEEEVMTLKQVINGLSTDPPWSRHDR